MTSNNARLDRRTFIHTSIAAGAVAGTAAAADDKRREEQTNSSLKSGSVILFQGDSITDAGRDRKNEGANNPKSLGDGYPLLIASELLRDLPDHQLKVFNRGISGNKVPDLQARWQTDCVDLKPDVLSILIGVNDIWHKLNGNYEGTVEDYETGYRALLKQTKSKLPESRIIICEPFALRCGAVNEKWFPEFDDRRAVAKKLAEEFDLTFVPFQSMFDEATKVAPPEYWAGDGVHPSLAGHALMAKTWRKVTGI